MIPKQPPAASRSSKAEATVDSAFSAFRITVGVSSRSLSWRVAAEPSTLSRQFLQIHSEQRS